MLGFPEPGHRRTLILAGGPALAGLLAFVVSGSRPLPPPVYPEGPPPGHTGGFGEPTCRACHADHPLNEPGGTLRVRGLPGRWEPGADYRLEVVLVREGLGKAGFQLSVRHVRGELAGLQAGRLGVPREGARVEITESGGVQYVQQSREGAETESAGRAAWKVRWTAPPGAGGPVVVHLAANAGNDDASEFGDRVYADSVVVEGPGGATPGS